MFKAPGKFLPLAQLVNVVPPAALMKPVPVGLTWKTCPLLGSLMVMS
jgi:hypothetical protein